MRICKYQRKDGSCKYATSMAYKIGLSPEKRVHCDLKVNDLYLFRFGASYYLIKCRKCPTFKPANGLEKRLKFEDDTRPIFDARNVSLTDPEEDEGDEFGGYLVE